MKETEEDINKVVESRMVVASEQSEKNVIKLKNFKFTENEVIGCLDRNEVGDAALFVRLFKDKYKYDCSTGEWYYWNEHYWRLDTVEQAKEDVNAVAEIYYNEISRQYYLQGQAENEGKGFRVKVCEMNIKKLNTRVHYLYSVSRKACILNLARSGVQSLGIAGNEWDSNPMVLAVKNGVIDLNTGELMDGKPSDHIKTGAPVVYKGVNEPCQVWVNFLHSTFDGNEELVKYVQKLLGYAMSGSTREHVYPIFWGEHGRNGKSTMFEMIKYILGPFTYKLPSEFIMESGFKASAASPDAALMNLRGKRIAWVSEAGKKDSLDIPKIKELSGGDTISGRLPFAKRMVEFEPTHTLFTLCNPQPRVSPNDAALWHRLRLIPFALSFVKNPVKKHERPVDADLKYKLKKEASGILSWLVRGHLLYIRDGLIAPAVVTEAGEAYRSDQDIIGHYVEECCVVIDDDDVRETLTDLYISYQDWCEEVGHKKMSKRNFSKKLSRKFEKIRNNGIYYKKINISLFPSSGI